MRKKARASAAGVYAVRCRVLALRCGCSATRSRSVLRSRQQGKSVARIRCARHPPRTRDRVQRHIRLLQHGRPGGGRLLAGEDRSAAAVCSAYNLPDEIRVIRNGQARTATQPIPPDVEGHVPGYKGLSPYDPATARARLDKFGYRDRDGDGFRELPDGRPLTIHQTSLVGAVYRQYDELWLKSMREVGIRMDFQVQTFPEAFKAAHAGQLQFSSFGWNGDIADDFMRLFYGPYAGAETSRDSGMPSTTLSTTGAAALRTLRNATRFTKP